MMKKLLAAQEQKQAQNVSFPAACLPGLSLRSFQKNRFAKKYDSVCEKYPKVPALLSMAKNFTFFVGSIALIRTFGDKLNVDGGI